MTIPASPAVRACLGGHEPTPEQWAAITHDPVPVAIVAGAGSGKTAIMAARIVWMTEEGLVRPSQILGLTFTTKAAGELEERVGRAFAVMDPAPAEQPSVATYNSFADRLVREHGVRIGIDPDVGLLSAAQQWQLLLGEFDRLPPFDAIDSRSMGSICRAALALADQCANHLVTPQRVAEEDRRILEEAQRFPDDVVRASRRRIELANVVKAYLDAKRRTRRIDFGDQVTKAVEILERHPDVAEELCRRYPALLLDEYQDTNVAQRRLLQLIAPAGHNVTAVGDARQNIYQWRGSTLFNLIDFPKRHFLRAGGEPHDYLSLSENFRCGSRILAVANRIVDCVPAERRPGNPLHAHAPNGEGWAGVKLASDQHEEAAFIAEEIARLHGEPACPGRPPTRWSDFAILVRRRSHIARLYTELRARDIPVEVLGLGGLLQVPEVVDTVAWLRVLADPGPPGNRWLARILVGPRFRIHYRDVALLARWAAHHTRMLAEAKRGVVRGPAADPGADQGPVPAGATGTGDGAAGPAVVPDETEFEPDDVAYSLAEALDHLDEIEGLGPEALRRLGRAREELQRLRPLTAGPLLELVRTVMDVTGIVEAVESTARADAQAARANLTNLLGAVASFAPLEGEASLATFLAYLDAAEEVEDTLDLATVVVGDSVKLMTVHRAKGLEFEVVFVPAVAARDNGKGERVDSVFPDERTSNPMTSFSSLPFGAREDAGHLPSPWKAEGADAGTPKPRTEFAKELKARAVEDERRLFYVALTRAKQRLYVTAAWWYERQGQPRGPSIFFDEVQQAPETEELPPAEQPAESPLKAKLQQQAVWPPDPPTRLRPDALFPESHAVALEQLQRGELAPEDILGRAGAEVREEAASRLASLRAQIATLHGAALRGPEPARIGPRIPGGPGGQAGAAAAPGVVPPSLSATQVVDLLEGAARPRDLSRPLPERPSDARRIGSEIHRWIEEQARSLTGLADEESLDAPAVHVDASRLDELKASYLAMGYAGRTLAKLESGEPMAELPFVLKVGDRLVRGRIDAVYEVAGGGLEIVDFKTGAEVEHPGLDQLAVYAAALALLGVATAGPLRLTYCYLATGRTDSRTMTAAEAAAVAGMLSERIAERIAEGPGM